MSREYRREKIYITELDLAIGRIVFEIDKNRINEYEKVIEAEKIYKTNGETEIIYKES